jgi:hypothetical protein
MPTTIKESHASSLGYLSNRTVFPGPERSASMDTDMIAIQKIKIFGSLVLPEGEAP